MSFNVKNICALRRAKEAVMTPSNHRLHVPGLRAPPRHAPVCAHGQRSTLNTALRIALAIALIALSGCVAFERAPVDELTCDPDLPGTWKLKAENLAKTLRIDERCHTEDWPGLGEQTMALDLTGFSLGEDRYIVISPADAQRIIGAEGAAMVKTTPAGSVFLVLYRIDKGRATAWLPDSQRALNAIAAGELKGRKLDEKFPLLQGSAQDIRDTLLQHGSLLYDTKKEAMVLERVTPPASKDSP